jgi:pimeloyl-ACP methyl ester carboxylesterase
MPGTRPVKSLGGLVHPGPDHDYGRQGRSPWLDVDWHTAQHRIEIEGREVNYCELGEGPAILFVHGLGASWQSWLEQLPEFAKGHRVVAMDLPGFGYSEMPRDDISIESYARWTGKFMDVVAIVSAAVVARALGRATDDIATRRRLRYAALATAGFRYPQYVSDELAHEMVRSARRTDGFLPALKALAGYNLEEELPKISCPTLIVWGADDQLVSVKDAERLEELIPDARREVFERTGHVAMLERPERFNRLLRAFLGEEPGQPESAELAGDSAL